LGGGLHFYAESPVCLNTLRENLVGMNLATPS